MFTLFQYTLLLNRFPLKEATAEFEKKQAITAADFENYLNEKKCYSSISFKKQQIKD